MKKLFSMLISIAMLASLCTGCASKEASSSTTGTPASAPESQSASAVVSDYPKNPIQLVVPYKAGGGVDKAARIISAPLEKELGTPFVVVNKPEGNGVIAISELKKQAPDGYNLMVVSNRDIFGHIVNKVDGVDYTKDDFTYIASILEMGDVLYTKTGGKYDSFEKLIAEAKSNPGKVTIAASNNTGKATIDLLGKKLGVTFSSIVYGSGNEAFTDLMGGHVDLALVASSFALQAQDQGLGGIAIFAGERMPTLKDVPTIVELGVDGVVSPAVRLLIGPKDLPKDVTDKIIATMDKLYAEGSEVVQTITKQGDNPRYMTGDTLKAFLDENYAMREQEVAGK